MNDKYYFLCNHWTEAGIGYAFPKGFYNNKFYDKGFSTVYTVEKMIDGAEEFNIHTSMELDAYSYELLKEVSIETLDRLKTAIKDGKVSVAGGTYAQPLGQDYGWESNIKQLVYGRKVIKDLLDYDVLTFLVEEQWFHPQLPQLLKKTGFKYASLQCQNSGQVFPINESIIDWEGLDNTVIPTIPANNIMVSCVRQYGNYDMYDEIIKEYENPLLFQWVEVWVPGMDWGASITPFEKAILDMKSKGYIPTSIDNYFEKVANNTKKKKIFIEYDSSNYGNDWYQGGGWGYEGDKVIYLNNICEEKISALENYNFLCTITNQKDKAIKDKKISEIWKEILLLQNHDVSVARSYRAYTKDGLWTTANELVVSEFTKIIKDIDEIANGSLLDFGINYRTFAHYDKRLITKEFTVKTDKHIGVKVNGESVKVSQYFENGLTHITLSFLAEPFEVCKLEVFEAEYKKISLNSNFFETNDFKVEHIDGWKIKITHKKTKQNIYYEAFSGSIGKGNEHGENYYALSPAHLQFTFMFDGSKHCPDQTSSMHVQCVGVEEDELFIKLKLKCNLLTLHTTDTPVAFASAEVVLNKESGVIDTNSFIYTGVFLNVDSCSKFTFDNEKSSIYRDYPFYEEETKLDKFYALSYTRVQDEKCGFTIKNYGSQRIFKDNNTLSFKLTKGNLLNDYRFKFSLNFETISPMESLSFVKSIKCLPIVVSEQAIEKISIKKLYDTTLISQLLLENNEKVVRIVNYSNKEVEECLDLCNMEESNEVDMMGNFLNKIDMKKLKLLPYEIKTIRLI